MSLSSLQRTRDFFCVILKTDILNLNSDIDRPLVMRSPEPISFIHKNVSVKFNAHLECITKAREKYYDYIK